MEYDKLYDKLAKQRVNIVIEYIEQILNDNNTVFGEINFDLDKNALIMEIKVYSNGFYRCFELIDKQYDYLIYKYLFNKIYERFVDSENIAICPLSRIVPEIINVDRVGISLFSTYTNSRIKLNFRKMTQLGSKIFNEEGDKYNQKIEEKLGRKITPNDMIQSYYGVKMYDVDENKRKKN